MRLLRLLHRWLGLVLALPLLFQGLTGALLVLLSFGSDSRPAVSTASLRLSPGALVASAREQAPAGLTPMLFLPPRFPGDSAAVGFAAGNQRMPSLELFTDPSDGQIVGQSSGRPVFALVRGFHTALLLPVPLGRSLVGIFAIGLFAMGVSGLVLWWPRSAHRRNGSWRRFFAVSRRARGARLMRETHLALGGWTTAMMLLMGGTGIALAYPDTARAVLGLSARDAPRDGAARPPHHRPAREPAPEDGLDDALGVLQRAEPGARVQEVRLGRGVAPFTIRFSLPELASGQFIQATVTRRDPVLSITRDPRRQRGGERVLMWVHALHEAKLPAWPAVQLAWSVLVGITGAALAGFALTGAAAWLLRRRRTGDRGAAAEVVVAGPAR